MGPWFVRGRSATGDFRLFCFPHAGGAASSFHSWMPALEDVEVCAVQLPGREARLREPPIYDMELLLAELVDALRPHCDRPFAFFGHSMGALVSYELARRLGRLELPQPQQLLVSGRQSPTLPSREPPLHSLPNADFVAELARRFDGLPDVIRSEPELMALFLPALRADLTMLERHVFVPGPPIDVPITVLGGRDDPHTSQADLAAWRPLTNGPFNMHLLPGGHFYLHDHREMMLQILKDELCNLREAI